MLYTLLQELDPEIDEIIQKEEQRQMESIELIASENFTSIAVLQANASILTNKYSEGQVGARYYGGNEHIDKIELLCKKRALSLFNLDPDIWDVNVQTLSGSVANFAVYTGLCGKNGKIMGLDLPSGGHLTHGYQTSKRKISATSEFFNSRAYKCTAEGIIDYDKLEMEFNEFQPDILICGGSAYVREFNYARMRKIAGEKILMMDMAHVSGLIAAGVMNNPFEYCDVVTTTSHKVLRGPRSGMIFYRKNKIIENRTIDIKRAIDSAVFPGLQGGPHNQKIAALAVALKQASTGEYHEYAKQVIKNAKAMVNEFTHLGYRLLTGGTDCHMILLNVESIGGAAVEKICELANICLNKNCIVSDSSPLNPSAIRLGTPAMTTRGLKEQDFITVTHFVDRAINIGISIAKGCRTERGTVNLIDFVSMALESKELRCLKQEVIEFARKWSIPCFNYRAIKN